MNCKLFTLWESDEKNVILDVALGNFAGGNDELVKIEERAKGYKVTLWRFKEEDYQLVWESQEVRSKYQNLLVEDFNNDELDELLIADSEGIKIYRWADKEFSVVSHSLDTGQETFLGKVKYAEKGLALISLSGDQGSFYRVGKSDLEKLGQGEIERVITLAETADIDGDGLNEVLIYSATSDTNRLSVYKVSNGILEEEVSQVLETDLESFAIGYMNNDSVLVLAREDGKIDINTLNENSLQIIGEKEYPDSEVKQLAAQVEMPGLVSLQLIPGLGKIKKIRCHNDKLLVLTKKNKLFVEKLTTAETERSSRFKPVTFIETEENSHSIKVENSLDINGQLLDVKTSVGSIEEKINATGIDLAGKLNCKYLYRTEDNKVLSEEKVFDFSTIIDNPSLNSTDWVEVEARPCNNVIDNKEGKYLLETELSFDARYLKQKDANFLTRLKDNRQEQFVETTIQVEEPIRRRRTQTVVKGIVNIPPTQDPAEQILETNARVRGLRVEPLFNKAVVRGILEVEILYVADTLAGDQPVFFIEDEIPFTAVIDIPGLRPGMSVFVRPIVEFVKSQLINGRTIEVTAVLALIAKVTAISPIDVIIDVNGNVDEDIIIDVGPIGEDVVAGVTEDIFPTFSPTLSPTQLEVEFPVGIAPVNDVIIRRQNQVLVEEAVEIPPQKPPVEEVLSVDANIIVEEIRVIPDKVIVRGIIRTVTRYVADTLAGDQPVHAVHEDIRFTGFVDLPGVRPGTLVDVQPILEYIRGRKKNSRTIDITAIVKLVATAFRRVRALVKA